MRSLYNILLCLLLERSLDHLEPKYPKNIFYQGGMFNSFSDMGDDTDEPRLTPITDAQEMSTNTGCEI